MFVLFGLSKKCRLEKSIDCAQLVCSHTHTQKQTIFYPEVKQDKQMKKRQ